MAILVYACLLLIFGISIGYTLYYVYEIDTLPLTMVMFLLVSFSIMVLHIQWKSAFTMKTLSFACIGNAVQMTMA